MKSEAFLEDCVITKNGKNAFSVFDPFSRLYISHCNVAGNEAGTYTEDTVITANKNPIIMERNNPNTENENKNKIEMMVEKEEYHPENKIENNNFNGIRLCSESNDILPTSLNTIKDRIFFVKKCVGDEEATLTFEKYNWNECSDDVLEEEEDSSEVSGNVIPKNNSKEVSVKNVPQNKNLPSDVPNTLKRKRKSDSNGSKNIQKELNSTALTNKNLANENSIKENKINDDIVVDNIGNFNFEFDGHDYDKMEILIKQEKFEIDDEQNDENYFGDLISTKMEKYE